MGKQPESRLQLKIRHALEIGFPGSWWMKVHGGPFQPAGVPDLLGCVQSRSCAIEVKLPGEEPSEIQIATMARMKRAGCIVGVATTIKEAVDVVLDGLKPPTIEMPASHAMSSSVGKVVAAYGRRRCKYCDKLTRITTAGCDHCDVEDK